MQKSDEEEKCNNTIDGRGRFKLKEIDILKRGLAQLTVSSIVFAAMWAGSILVLGISIGVTMWIVDHVRAF